MSDWRRCEILWPLKFNDGQPVPRQLLIQTLSELEERFSAISCEAQIIHGIWRHQGQRFRDDLVRVFVDFEDQPTHRDFFIRYKNTLKERFKQIDVWMTSHPIDVM